MTPKNKTLLISITATILAMTVVMLGAYTRLKHAGLGCPDWPMCYGQITVPSTQTAIHKAQQAYPNAHIIPEKAWPEMIHRYFAGTLGLLIFFLAGTLIRQKKFLIPLLLIGMVTFQALLGMWTVTLLLLPLVVMGHLLGGMSITATLWWLSLRNMNTKLNTISPRALNFLKFFAFLGLAIIILQIFLGGWTSSNYASAVCPNFPYCHGSFFPKMDFVKAFNLTSPIGINYEGGVLNSTTRTTIQMTHRYGAFITAFYVLCFGYVLTRFRNVNKLPRLGWLLITVILAQFLLGIANIDTHLALPVAVAHNVTALILLLSMITTIHFLFRETQTQ